MVDGGPDAAPLTLLGRIAPGHEIGEGPEGDQVFSEKRSRPNIVDRLHVIGEALKPAADKSDILVSPIHDRLRRWCQRRPLCDCREVGQAVGLLSRLLSAESK